MKGKNSLLKLYKNDMLFLSNNGSFLLLSFTKKSRFFGWFVPFENYYIKILDSIKNKYNSTKKPKKIILLSNNYAKVIYDNFSEEYFLGKTFLIYRINKACWNKIYLDIRNIYDTGEWNRIYNVKIVNNRAEIYFQKKFSFKLNITKYLDVKVENKWEEMYLDYDYERRSPPFKRWVFVPIQSFGNELLLYFGRQPKQIKKRAAKNIYELLKLRIRDFIHDWISVGYPWYYQEWIRDVLISLRGIYLIGLKNVVRDKLIEYIKCSNSCGKLYNFIGANGSSVDTLGWYIKRFFEFMDLLDQNLQYKIIAKLKDLIYNFEECLFDEREKLFFSYPHETWMDSLDRRYPIEVQFLMLNAYDKMYRITKEEHYLKMLKILKESIRKYIEDHTLLDTIGDRSIRPNIFLSYYIYPNIFSKGEWERFFDYALTHLWLEWGGLSSISKYDKRFIPEHNGDNYFSNRGKSLHSGDSWYYINHISAIAMYKLNKSKYKEYIKRIVDASTKTLLEIGTLPEVSSAKERTASGAISQLWSLCTFVELLHDIDMPITTLFKDL